MSVIAIICDTHFGVRSDAPAVYHHMQKFYERVFFPTLKEHGVTRLLHGGDYCDRRKFINFATSRFIEDHYRTPLRELNIIEDVIIGNHDCFLRDSTDINSVAELYRHDPTVRFYTQPIEIDVDGCGILLLPWICGNNRDATMKMIATSTAQVVLGHLEISGFQMYRGMPSHEGLDPSLFDRFSLVMSGHYHHRSSTHPIQYLGAPYPMVWSDYSDPRGFHLFDTETHALTFVPNPYTMFARLVYDDLDKPNTWIADMVNTIVASDSPYHDAYVKVVVKNKTQAFWFELIMDALAKVNALDVMIVDDVQSNDSEGNELPTTDIDTLTLMQEYVEGLSISCDKTELKSYLNRLYHDVVTASQSARLS